MTEDCAQINDNPDIILCMQDIFKSSPGGVRANRGVNLEVLQGEIHCLLGENGAGKTVLMSILYGLYTPDSGSIFFKTKSWISITQKMPSIIASAWYISILCWSRH